MWGFTARDVGSKELLLNAKLNMAAMPEVTASEEVHFEKISPLKEFSQKLCVRVCLHRSVAEAEKIQQLGISDFRAFLNIAMLLTEKEWSRVPILIIIFYSLTFNNNEVLCHSNERHSYAKSYCGQRVWIETITMKY